MRVADRLVQVADGFWNAAAPGNILHVAVRRTAPDRREAFAEAQARFLELLLGRDGVGPHYELKAVKGMGSVDGITVGLTVFASDEAMASAYEALGEHEAFMAYVSTFETLASQFARSVDNTRRPGEDGGLEPPCGPSNPDIWRTRRWPARGDPARTEVQGGPLKWSGRLDSNQRPPAPKAGALPGCATPRCPPG